MIVLLLMSLIVHGNFQVMGTSTNLRHSLAVSIKVNFEAENGEDRLNLANTMDTALAIGTDSMIVSQGIMTKCLAPSFLFPNYRLFIYHRK